MLQCSEDGDVMVRQLTAEQVTAHLDEEIRDDVAPEHRTQFAAQIPGLSKSGYSNPQEDWGRSTILIKGRIVVPKPVQMVTKYEVP